MVKNKVFWSRPWIRIASRDLIDRRTCRGSGPICPTMEVLKRTPSHGSCFFSWTTREVRWKNIDVWIIPREFANKGGLISAADDSGFIFNLYGLA
jgi:hypothetical protein